VLLRGQVQSEPRRDFLVLQLWRMKVRGLASIIFSSFSTDRAAVHFSLPKSRSDLSSLWDYTHVGASKLKYSYAIVLQNTCISSRMVVFCQRDVNLW